jgi:hypothetical protein
MNKIKFISITLFIFSTICHSQDIKHNPWSLIIYRPENSYHINEIPCYIKFEDAITKEDVTFSKIKANYSWASNPKDGYNYKKSYYLYGGMIMHCLLKPGQYNITTFTPKDKLFNAEIENKEDWNSNTFYYNTENPTKVIFISPTVDENGFYNGNWYIDYKAPEFWKFTKGKKS